MFRLEIPPQVDWFWPQICLAVTGISASTRTSSTLATQQLHYFRVQPCLNSCQTLSSLHPTIPSTNSVGYINGWNGYLHYRTLLLSNRDQKRKLLWAVSYDSINTGSLPWQRSSVGDNGWMSFCCNRSQLIDGWREWWITLYLFTARDKWLIRCAWLYTMWYEVTSIPM